MSDSSASQFCPFGREVAAIPPDHYMVVYFPETETFSFIIRKWLTSDETTWYGADKKVHGFLKKSAVPDQKNKHWKQFKCRVFLQQVDEDDVAAGYKTVSCETYREADIICSEITDRTYGYTICSDPERGPRLAEEEEEPEFGLRRAGEPVNCFFFFNFSNYLPIFPR
jgi:hypothetical protein